MSNQQNQNMDDEIAEKLREFRLKSGQPADGPFGKSFKSKDGVRVTVLAPNQWTRMADEPPPQMTWVWGRIDSGVAHLMFYRTSRFFIDEKSGSINNRHPFTDDVIEWVVIEDPTP